MQIILLIMLIICFISLPKKALPARFLCCIIMFSVLASLLLPTVVDFFSFSGLGYFMYTGLVLSVFLYSLGDYITVKKSILDLNKAQNFFVLIIIILGLICFLINVYIVYSTMTHFLAGDFSVVEFKNGGDTQLKLSAFVSPILLTYTNYFSSLGFLGLGLHFYFLVKGKSDWLVAAMFIVSLNLPLSGLQALSRAFTVLYLFQYVFLFLFVKDVMPVPFKKLVYRAGSIAFLLILILFFVISYNRFSGESGHYTIPDGSLITDPLFFSTLDYFSQWLRNGFVTFELFDLNKFWGAKTFSTTIDRFQSLLGYSSKTYVELRYATLGTYASKFNGIVSTLVYDLTHVGVILFLMINAFFIKLFSSNKSLFLEPKTIIMLPFFFSIPSMFFTNNFGVYLSIQLGFVYAVVFILLSKIKIYSLKK